jgi:ferrous iron transport protein B
MLHPVAGPLVFAFVVILVFQSIFSYVTPLMDGVKWLFEVSGNWIATTLPPSLVRSLVVDGVWRGVGSVIVFLPQVLLLFLFIGILEDSGYLARAALIADRTMARFGLQGKSFIPLLSAYACAVPAILSTRTIENKRDRTATILIAPFMTCAARFPVYTLIIAAFLPNRQLLGFLSVRTVAMIGLYALGFVVAVLTARILKSSILKSGRTPFVLEMPAYRWPTVQSLGLRLLDRSKVFLRRAGTVILLVTVLLWTAAHVPYTHGHPPAIRDSLAGTLGRSIEPVIKPLGFDWKIGIGIITSFAARETIIATLGAIYGMDHPDSTSMDLQSALRHDLTPASAVALLIFFAFAMQCVSTVAVVRRETGGWKWPLAQFAYMSALAYGGAFLAAHLLRYV